MIHLSSLLKNNLANTFFWKLNLKWVINPVFFLYNGDELPQCKGTSNLVSHLTNQKNTSFWSRWFGLPGGKFFGFLVSRQTRSPRMITNTTTANHILKTSPVITNQEIMYLYLFGLILDIQNGSFLKTADIGSQARQKSVFFRKGWF